MTETVLFVDDEENILNSVIRTFADSHFIIRTAPDASKALDLVRNETIAVLVSDNMMPGIDRKSVV